MKFPTHFFTRKVPQVLEPGYKDVPGGVFPGQRCREVICRVLLEVLLSVTFPETGGKKHLTYCQGASF